jgi:hypothetical protein
LLTPQLIHLIHSREKTLFCNASHLDNITCFPRSNRQNLPKHAGLQTFNYKCSPDETHRPISGRPCPPDCAFFLSHYEKENGLADIAIADPFNNPAAEGNSESLGCQGIHPGGSGITSASHDPGHFGARPE